MSEGQRGFRRGGARIESSRDGNSGEAETAGNAGERGRKGGRVGIARSCAGCLSFAWRAPRGNLASARARLLGGGYSYNQPSRGTVVMVTTTTTTRSGLGGVFKDIFAFAASLLPLFLLSFSFSCSLSLSSALSSVIPAIFLLLSFSLRFRSVFIFPSLTSLFLVHSDCFSSRDL